MWTTPRVKEMDVSLTANGLFNVDYEFGRLFAERSEPDSRPDEHTPSES